MSTIPYVSDPSNLTAFEADMLSIEREISVRQNAEQAQDAHRCTGCGDITEGASVMGSHVQVCPDCIAEFVTLNHRPLPPRRPVDSRKFITMYV
jgi:hypothetical protein